MKQNLNAQAKFNKLREQAERLMIKPNFVTEQSAFEDPLRLINELQVCHVELEMQNDELQRSQQEFMESQIRYKELYDLAPIGYVTVNLKGLILKANLILADMLSMERCCLINQPLSTYIHFKDQDIFYHHQRDLYDLKTGQSCKLRMQKKDGTQFIVQLESNVISDKYENPEKYRIVVIDITERTRIEEKLGESEKKYQLIIETIVNGLQEVDIYGTILFANSAYYKMLGYDDGELLGRTIYETLQNDHDRKAWRDYIQMLIQQQAKPEPLFGKVVKKNGDTIDVQVDWNYIRNSLGKVTGFLSIISDITDRNKTVKALKENQERCQSLSEMLRLMCDNVPDMIWAKDLEKRYTFANKAICQNLLNATDTEEPIGRTDLFFAERERTNHSNNPNWHTFGELCQDSDTITMEIGTPQHFDEFGNVKGEYLFLDVHKAPFIDEKGKIIGTVGSARDVTQAKKIDKELKELNEVLEERIKKRTSSLEEVNTALRVLLAKRDEDKNKTGENIYANFKSLIQPLLSQLRNSHTKNVQEEILNILESTIREMATPFSKRLSDPMVGLTPTEIQVATLVKEGKTNKEITEILSKSIRAVSSHRDNIRHKLGLKNKKINLRTYLLSMD